MKAPAIPISLRPEQHGDEDAIHALIEAAFRDMKMSDGGEPDLVRQLRASGSLALSLVAENDRRIVGHIAFSPVAIEDGTKGWFGLGPVTALPRLQRQGIGSALIRRGIADLRVADAQGIVVLGEPGYYERFGFEHRSELRLPGPPPEYFQAMLLAGEWPRGAVRYAPAFGLD